MRGRLLLGLLVASLVGVGRFEQIFSSVAHMNDLVSLERRLMYKVGHFLHRMETKLGYLRRSVGPSFSVRKSS